MRARHEIELGDRARATEATGSYGTRIARGVSLTLHPFVIAPAAIVVILALEGNGPWASLGWAALCAVFVVGPALTAAIKEVRGS